VVRLCASVETVRTAEVCAKLRTIIHITPRAPVHCGLQPVNVNVF
jgi:hypothetical protein